jgi:uncharacterized membrane protein YoaK (UPF0700 family)
VTDPEDAEKTRSLWFALLLTLANGFLDAHTYIARGGVFANVQTANVIFGAIETSKREWALALAHLWPLLAFIAGVTLASHIKSGRLRLRRVDRRDREQSAGSARDLAACRFPCGHAASVHHQ